MRRCSCTIAFTSARARRPLKARVIAVEAKAASTERLFHRRRRTALGAAQESRSALDEVGPARQEICDVVGSAHAAGGDQRGTGAAPDRGEQRAHGAVLIGTVVVGQAGPVARRLPHPGGRARPGEQPRARPASSGVVTVQDDE